MSEQINIEDFKALLGENYETVEAMWKKMNEMGLRVTPKESIPEGIFPVGACNEYEIVLVQCITFVTFAQEHQIDSFTVTDDHEKTLKHLLLASLKKNHKVVELTTVKITKAFLIVVQQ